MTSPEGERISQERAKWKSEFHARIAKGDLKGRDLFVFVAKGLARAEREGMQTALYVIQEVGKKDFFLSIGCDVAGDTLTETIAGHGKLYDVEIERIIDGKKD